MDRQARQAKKEVRRVVPTLKSVVTNITPQVSKDKKAVLEGISQHIHLVGTDGSAHTNIVLATNHIEGVGDGENISPALERRKTAITERPIRATHNGRSQSATYTVCFRLRKARRGATGKAGTTAVQISPRDPKLR